MSLVRLSHPTGILNGKIQMPSSKSESNRLLVLQRLTEGALVLSNLSNAEDTVRMQTAIASKSAFIDIGDAGTAMRFLTAMYACLNEEKVITGSARMQERPIKPLVEALNNLGFHVEYTGTIGYPPVRIIPTAGLHHIKQEVTIEADVSSQFITALMLIAPFLPQGLTIHFATPPVSSSYIELTVELLKQCGVEVAFEVTYIRINPVTFFKSTSFHVGGDWSAASYWYAMLFLSKEGELYLQGMKDEWSQGDRVVADWMKRFGVVTTFDSGGAWLRKKEVVYPKLMKLNFKDNPDIAQTFAVMFAAADIYATFSGIETLRIKETDRITALHNELLKIGIAFEYADLYDFYQLKGTFKPTTSVIETYGDHRMAMSFACLAIKAEVSISNPFVAGKSYPDFWNHMQQLGFEVQFS